MTLSKRRKITLSLVIILTMLVTSLSTGIAFAATLDEVNEPSTETSFTSSNMSDENVKVTTNDSEMTVNFRTLIPAYEYRIVLYGVDPATKINDIGANIPAAQVDTSTLGKPVYGFSYTIDFSQLTNIQDGSYFLMIQKIDSVAETYRTTANGAVFKNMAFTVSDGQPYISRYNDVIANNKEKEAIGAAYDTNWYLDNYLNDIRFVLKIPSTTVYEDMDESKIAYIKTISDRVCAGASSDYDKLLKIYEYTTGSFYYDSYAYSRFNYQYANPYNNIYNHENNVAAANSDGTGRVATTCQGFAAIYLALARAQGIPTRFVYGHRALPPSTDWGNEANIGKKDHWWAESYVNGRWIFVDATVGTNNKWNRLTGVWQYFGVTNYTYFDPTEEEIATSHIYHNIYPDMRYGWRVSDENEVSKLTAFLETPTSSYSTNGKLMNEQYVSTDKKTWGDGMLYHFMGNGYGNITKIQWSEYNLQGDMDLSGFSKLSVLSMRGNALTSANLSNDTSLSKVFLDNNKLTSIDLTNDKSLTYLNTSGNALKSAALYANGKNINITAGDRGTFYVNYSRSNRKDVTLVFKPDIGYKAKLTNYSGKVLWSSGNVYTMNPGWGTYNISYVLNPNSYRYYLSSGSTRTGYIKAVQTRLTELGYYAGSISGTYDEATKAAVATFQRANGVTTLTGDTDKLTWNALFNTNAVVKPSDEVLTEITAVNNIGLTIDSSSIAKTKTTASFGWTVNPDTATGMIPETGGIVYQVWKSKDGESFTKAATTSDLNYTASNLTKNTTYTFKVRAARLINGKYYYGAYTTVTIRTKK